MKTSQSAMKNAFNRIIVSPKLPPKQIIDIDIACSNISTQSITSSDIGDEHEFNSHPIKINLPTPAPLVKKPTVGSYKKKSEIDYKANRGTKAASSFVLANRNALLALKSDDNNRASPVRKIHIPQDISLNRLESIIQVLTGNRLIPKYAVLENMVLKIYENVCAKIPQKVINFKNVSASFSTCKDFITIIDSAHKELIQFTSNKPNGWIINLQAHIKFATSSKPKEVPIKVTASKTITHSEISKSAETGDIILLQGKKLNGRIQRFFTRSEYGMIMIKTMLEH